MSLTSKWWKLTKCNSRSNFFLFVWGVVNLLVICGCGSSSSGSAVPAELNSNPKVLTVSPAHAEAGDVLIIEGENLALDPSDIEVRFQSRSSETILGQVIELSSVAGSGGSQLTSNQGNSLCRVVVPTGASSGSIEVLQRASAVDGFEPIGELGFTAGPIIVGHVAINNYEGYVALDAQNRPLQTTVAIYGSGVEAITSAELVDQAGNQFACEILPDIVGIQTTIPEGMTAVSIDFSSHVLNFNFPDPVNFLTLRSTASQTGGAAFQVNDIQIAFRGMNGAGQLADLPACVSGMVVESGVLAGNVRIVCALNSEPATGVLFQPEYLNPVSGLWEKCTPVQADILSCDYSQVPPCEILATEDYYFKRQSGNVTSDSSGGIFVGVGAYQEFLWDSLHDLPAYQGKIVVRVLPEKLPSAASSLFGEMRSPVLAIDNRMDSGEGKIKIDLASLDEGSKNSIWDSQSNSELRVPAAEFGQGAENLVLLEGHTYLWSIEYGSIVDISDPNNVLPVLASQDNPGAAAHEFHLKSLIIEQNVAIELSQAGFLHPGGLVIRCSGAGVPGETNLQIDSAIDLSGTDGEFAEFKQSSGVPGLGGPGGKAGGGGGAIYSHGGILFGLRDGRQGFGAGGGGGASNYSPNGTDDTVFFASCGGGGGFGSFGDDARHADSTRIRPGLGGTERGSAGLHSLIAGSGGGGGGATVVVDPFSPLVISEAFGGSGGGGGGRFLAVVNGSVVLGSTITANGGNGGVGTQRAIGQGGGGSGVAIKIQCTGDMVFEDNYEINAFGGKPPISNHLNYAAGKGAPGRIRLEAGGNIVYPDLNSATAILPNLGTEGVDAFVVGEGFGLGSTGNTPQALISLVLDREEYLINTSLGTISNSKDNEILYSNESANGVFHFNNFTLSEDTTVRVTGRNPFILVVHESCNVYGTLDGSGQDGGAVDYNNPLDPVPGRGGLGGPGGGDGGAGGRAGGLQLVHGGDGQLPPDFPLILTQMQGSGSSSPAPVSPATGGLSSNSIVPVAGSGGGGGHTIAGLDGFQLPSAVAGVGGSALGDARFSYLDASGQSRDLRIGGSGGAGGGGNGAASIFDHNPGSGGGGGGGYLQIIAYQVLDIGPECQILANGGDSYQSLVGSGQGGAGAGGTIRLHANNLCRIDPAAKIEVQAGAAYVSPTQGPLGELAMHNTSGASHGRIQISARYGFGKDAVIGLYPAPSIAPFASANSSLRILHTKAIPLLSATGAQFGGAQVQDFDLSPRPSSLPASSYRVLFSGAKRSLSKPGTYENFAPGIDDPKKLGPVDALRLTFVLLEDSNGQAPEIDEISFSIGDAP